MDKQHIPDNRFYIILAIAILALIVGATGLIVGLQKPMQKLPQASGTNQGGNNIITSEIDPSTVSGVVESHNKN